MRAAETSFTSTTPRSSANGFQMRARLSTSAKGPLASAAAILPLRMLVGTTPVMSEMETFMPSLEAKCEAMVASIDLPGPVWISPNSTSTSANRPTRAKPSHLAVTRSARAIRRPAPG